MKIIIKEQGCLNPVLEDIVAEFSFESTKSDVINKLIEGAAKYALGMLNVGYFEDTEKARKSILERFMLVLRSHIGTIVLVEMFENLAEVLDFLGKDQFHYIDKEMRLDFKKIANDVFFAVMRITDLEVY